MEPNMGPGTDARLKLKLESAAQCYTKVSKVVNNAARPPEGGPAEPEGLSASSLQLSIDRPVRMPYRTQKSYCTKPVANHALLFVINLHATSIQHGFY